MYTLSHFVGQTLVSKVPPFPATEAYRLVLLRVHESAYFSRVEAQMKLNGRNRIFGILHENMILDKRGPFFF